MDTLLQRFGYSISLSDKAERLVVGSPHEGLIAQGMNSLTTPGIFYESGAAYIY